VSNQPPTTRGSVCATVTGHCQAQGCRAHMTNGGVSNKQALAADARVRSQTRDTGTAPLWPALLLAQLSREGGLRCDDVIASGACGRPNPFRIPSNSELNIGQGLRQGVRLPRKRLVCGGTAPESFDAEAGRRIAALCPIILLHWPGALAPFPPF
jgi:hypothetical protein